MKTRAQPRGGDRSRQKCVSPGPPEITHGEGIRCARDLLKETLLKDKGILKEGGLGRKSETSSERWQARY